MLSSQAVSSDLTCSLSSSLLRRKDSRAKPHQNTRQGACLTYRQFNYTDCKRGRWLVLFKDINGKRIFQRKYVACDSWSCEVCGQIKKRKMYKLIKKACPKSEFYMLTVTLKKNTSSLKDNWKLLSKNWNKLLTHLRKRVDKLKYFRVVELQKNGMPHIHALINCTMNKKEIHTLWLKITGDSFIAQFEKIKYSAASYVLKYFQKCVKDLPYIREETGKKTKLFVYSRFLLVREVRQNDWSLWSMHKIKIEAVLELETIKRISRHYFARAGPLEIGFDKNNILLSVSFKSHCEF